MSRPNAAIAARGEPGESIDHLAAGVQALVHNMRQEQQLVRDWIEAQADRQDRLQAALENLIVAKDDWRERLEPR